MILSHAPSSPFLEYLTGFLNQDLDLVFGGPIEAAREFALGPADEVRAAREGVQDLLDRCPDDPALIAEVVRLGCDYVPIAPGEMRRMLLDAVRLWQTLEEPRS